MLKKKRIYLDTAAGNLNPSSLHQEGVVARGGRMAWAPQVPRPTQAGALAVVRGAAGQLLVGAVLEPQAPKLLVRYPQLGGELEQL
ncbi:MAG: hypothetical protein AAB589_02580 [Patescibacteria group bacterium]